jgi:hypothetical protein
MTMKNTPKRLRGVVMRRLARRVRQAASATTSPPNRLATTRHPSPHPTDRRQELDRHLQTTGRGTLSHSDPHRAERWTEIEVTVHPSSSSFTGHRAVPSRRTTPPRDLGRLLRRTMDAGPRGPTTAHVLAQGTGHQKATPWRTRTPSQDRRPAITLALRPGTVQAWTCGSAVPLTALPGRCQTLQGALPGRVCRRAPVVTAVPHLALASRGLGVPAPASRSARPCAGSPTASTSGGGPAGRALLATGCECRQRSSRSPRAPLGRVATLLLSAA